jgi:glyoxylase-like metal-dependent hydrolase (beta-lactamase superfamily II)
VKNSETVTIGGMRFRIHHNGAAHTDNDIMIEVVEEKVLFYGDVVRSQQVSEFMDSFKGNIEAIDLGLKSGATRFIPGHGPGFDRQTVQTYRDFLSTIRSQVARPAEMARRALK